MKREKVVEKKSKVAQMGIWGMNMNLEFYDPCAVKVCGDTILEINKKLKEKFNVDMKLASVEYHYTWSFQPVSDLSKSSALRQALYETIDLK